MTYRTYRHDYPGPAEHDARSIVIAEDEKVQNGG